MEARIRRGKLLRSLLVQERLRPLAPEFHMAWLVAFNEGMLDGLEADKVGSVLASLAGQVAASHLTLEQSRATWVEAVRSWLGSP
jgi:F-type H+-transporting ATPase subunit alpha